jgi:hypothetical protein
MRWNWTEWEISASGLCCWCESWDNIATLIKSTETLIDTSKEVGLEENRES